MFQEYSLENSIKNPSWITLSNSICNIMLKNETNTALTTEINRQVYEISQAQVVEKLSLFGNCISELPSRLTECLTNLVYLNLANNQLNALPNSISVLQKLIYLNLDSNKFFSIPSIICELTSLHTLTARNNCIQDTPKNLENLKNLEKLDLSSNKLRDLPSSYSNMNRLKNLSLANNQFKIIPSCIENGMYTLQEFNLSQNSHAELNVFPKSVELISFYAERNATCPMFPKWILNSKYKNLETVSLNGTAFKKFNLLETQLKSNLKVLSMKQCQMSETIIEKIIAEITNLERLIIGNTGAYQRNNFWYMPITSLRKPSSLKEIDVSGTEIPLIPEIINKFVNLSILDISSNNITWLPEEICSLTKLNALMIDNNELAMLPENIDTLISLKELKACHNKLCDLPDTLEALKNLQYIDLYNNEFEAVPKVLMKLSGLIGLDVDQNYFSTDNLLLNRSTQYESMRAILRDRWSKINERLIGTKEKSPELLESLSDTSSFSSSYSRTNNSSPMGSPFEEDINNYTSEHWDTSEDSADEFDPNASLSDEEIQKLAEEQSCFRRLVKWICQLRTVTKNTCPIVNDLLERIGREDLVACHTEHNMKPSKTPKVIREVQLAEDSEDDEGAAAIAAPTNTSNATNTKSDSQNLNQTTSKISGN
ncbi:uncharacterized protein LOC116431279 isoform X2 [Nomia melanderi]|uniref:uncharacterized protein LOC116431279 isoform X2 n=1 Tax=Nomia melanderi TaxID=2448451 RepID=UPI003FCD507E